jgi:RhoGEF domain/SOS1/NGEF-like PH domain
VPGGASLHASSSSDGRERGVTGGVAVRRVRGQTAARVQSIVPEAREYVVHEIVMSENKYLQDLRIILDSFLAPIRREQMLELKALSHLFSNIELIEMASADLLKAFEAKVMECDDAKEVCVGELFLSQIETLLPIYTPYCLNQAQAVETYERLMAQKKSPFAVYVRQMMMAPECNGLPLMSYLIKPVQRLCKYPLLLRELLKLTNRSHPDREPLERALEQTALLVDEVNESKRHAENLRKLLQIEMRLELRKNLKIVVPGRLHLHDGRLVKITHGKRQERHFFLFSDLLIWAKPIKLKSNRYEFKGFAPLNRLAISHPIKSVDAKLGFLITRNDTQKRYVINAKDAADKKQWFELLSNAIQEAWGVADAPQSSSSSSAPAISVASSSASSPSSSPSRPLQLGDLFGSPPPSPKLVAPASSSASSSSSLAPPPSPQPSRQRALTGNRENVAFSIKARDSLKPDNNLQMADVEQRIVGYKVTQRGRMFVREIACTISKRQRYLFLFSDSDAAVGLLVATTRKSPKVYTFKSAVPLDNATLNRPPQQPLVLELASPTLTVPLCIHIASASAFQEWLDDLQGMLDNRK